MKNIVKWILAGLILTGLIIMTVFLLLRKKIQSNNKIVVNLTIQGPYPKPQTASVNLDNNNLPFLTVEQFIGLVINTSKILPWSIADTYWLSITISGKSVQILEGHVATHQTLYNLLGITSPPTSIDFSATYKNACSPSNYPSTLDSCLGQTGICTSTGWTIIDYQYCPSGDDLYRCCTDPNNPYPTCTDNKVTCTQCQGTLDCGDPGCGLLGPKCTATGWLCAPGYACPTGNSLDACCTGTDHAVCNTVGGRANLICSGCTGTPPVCTPDCNMCGLVCDSDGNWSCRQGAHCPAENSCCTDPAKPHSFCSPIITNGPFCTDPPGNVSIKCDTCESLVKPKDPKCIQGSCEGHGYICTSAGWICAPGVTCPDPNLFGSLQQCCPSEYMANTPYCDPDKHCIKCACPSGFTGCGESQLCGAPTSQCNKICCPNGIPCSLGPDGNCICCPPERVCPMPTGGEICCQPGTICKDGQCLIPCGLDPVTGTGVICDSTKQCIEIDNLSQENIAKLRLEYGDKIRINDNSAFMCINPPSCTFTANESSLPASIHNFYPCLPFPDKGYCTESNLIPTGECFRKYATESECAATGSCTWRNILKYATSNKDPGITLNQMQKEMAVIQGSTPDSYIGYFCNKDEASTAYSRVVAYTSDAGACNWDDCWGRISQPGVIDIEYNPENGVCVALQSCNNSLGGMQSYKLNQTNGVLQSNNYQISPTTTTGNSSFGLCSVQDCPSEIQQYEKEICAGSCAHCTVSGKEIINGQVIKKLYSCGPENSFQCVLDGGQAGITSVFTCDTMCCPLGMTGVNGNCYIYNPPIGDVPKCDEYGTQSGNCTSSVVNNIPTRYSLCCHTEPGAPFKLGAHAACTESISEIPYKTYYCANSGNTSGGCGDRYYGGTWTLCDNPSGCSQSNNWYWDNGGGSFGSNPSYCRPP